MHNPDTILLSRTDFRESVFDRDNNKCVLCDNPGQDAHHIIERRLFPDGGYYIDNGATVCGACHLLCEQTEISVQTVREAANIQTNVLPPHLYADVNYDKWGNIIQPNDTRLRGELFYDTSVQKILKQSTNYIKFVDYVKYPRTYHLPWSPGLHDDDRMMSSVETFNNCNVVVTEKMDGENTTMYCDYIHARSIDGRSHGSRDWVKNFWSSIAHDIPKNMRICGENVYAEHSIVYESLPTYFLGFAIWERDKCLSWADTLEWFSLLGITPVPTIYEGPFDIDVIRALPINDPKNHEHAEGYTIRKTESFGMGEFRSSVGKFVRKDHIRTVKHWMHGSIITPNKLSSSN